MTSRFCDNLGRPMKSRILNVTLKQEAKPTAERSTKVNKQERRLLYKYCSGNSNAILTVVKQRFASSRPARFSEFRMFLFRRLQPERLAARDVLTRCTAQSHTANGRSHLHLTPGSLRFISSSSSCSWRVRHVSCSLILKMKLVPPSLPRSSYVSSSFWFIL